MKNLLICSIFFLISACSKTAPDSQYLGKWVSTVNQNVTIEITRNGDNYLLNESHPSFVTRGKTDTTHLPAVLKDGMLQVQNGFGPVNIAYVEKTDTITMPGGFGGSVDYHRVK